MSKKGKGIIIGIIALILLAIGIKAYEIMNSLYSVKNGYFNNYQDKTVSEGFNNFLGDEKWEYYKEDGMKFVTVRGNCTFKDSDVTMKVYFKLNDDGSFKVTKITMDGEDVPSLLESSFIEKVMTSE